MIVKSSREMDIDRRLANLIEQAGGRDRINIEKHLAACDAELDPGHAMLWRRLMVKLSELAPLPVCAAGTKAVRFFIADGKYRMQVFALEDNSDGLLSVYLPDVTAQAMSEDLIVKNGEQYAMAGASDQVLRIQPMDGGHTIDPPEYIKHLMGWNRKAVKLTLLTCDASGPQVDAAEHFCALAAKHWASSSG